MDADDISFSDRLEKQLNYFKKHSNTVAIGGQCVVIDENNHLIGNKNFPTEANKLKEMIFWAIPMQQPSTMINLKKLPKNFTWYSPSVTSAEEINLMFRLMLHGNIANLSQNILFYRHLNNSLSHKNPKETFKLTLKSRYDALSLGFKPSIKAIFINILQIIAVLTIPSHLINEIWCQLRGIKTNNNLSVRTYAQSQV
jgi:hypothetical protein